MNLTNTSNAKLSPKKQRIWELDFLRGVCVLLMIFDHTMFDLGYVFGRQWFLATNIDFFQVLYKNAQIYWACDLRNAIRPIVLLLFTTICGISCSFSRSNLKRGIIIALLSVGITIVTTLIEEPIRFGIFHMFTVAILGWTLINFICRKDKIKTAYACGVLGVLIVAINYILMQLHQENPLIFTSNNDWYFIGEFLTNGNMGEVELKTADYQPIFPLVGYVFIGAAIGPFLYKNKKTLMPHIGKYDWYAPFNFWGKLAMWVYVLHQVVIAAILGIISFVFITPGNFIII